MFARPACVTFPYIHKPELDLLPCVCHGCLYITCIARKQIAKMWALGFCCESFLFPPPRANKLLWLIQPCAVHLTHSTIKHASSHQYISKWQVVLWWTKKESQPCFLAVSSPTPNLGVTSGVVCLDCWSAELDLFPARRVGKERRRPGEVYDFVHRNNLSLCIFSLWTWASLNFGELNLYLPPRYKVQACKRECGPLQLKKLGNYFNLWFCHVFYVASQG